MGALSALKSLTLDENGMEGPLYEQGMCYGNFFEKCLNYGKLLLILPQKCLQTGLIINVIDVMT